MRKTIDIVIAIISIHAPREGGDQQKRHKTRNQDISIHAPREGGDTTETS